MHVMQCARVKRQLSILWVAVHLEMAVTPEQLIWFSCFTTYFEASKIFKRSKPVSVQTNRWVRWWMPKVWFSCSENWTFHCTSALSLPLCLGTKAGSYVFKIMNCHMINHAAAKKFDIKAGRIICSSQRNVAGFCNLLQIWNISFMCQQCLICSPLQIFSCHYEIEDLSTI